MIQSYKSEVGYLCYECTHEIKKINKPYYMGTNKENLSRKYQK